MIIGQKSFSRAKKTMGKSGVGINPENSGIFLGFPARLS